MKLRDENRSLEAQRYIAQFGFDNWLHLHHYCYGQNFLSRAAKAADAKDRSSQRRLATKEYEYVLRGVRPDFWMRPQLYVELGRIYQQLGDAARATGLFNDAIRVSPGYQAAYLALVAQLRQSGSGREALAVATEGLRNLPDSEALKKAYKELGGTEPFPSPVAGKSAPAKEEAAAAPQEPAVTPQESAAAPRDAATDEGADPAPNANGETAEGDAGGRKCRFCPPEDIQDRWRKSFEEPAQR
ncbi:tetratricopeptide repeat protein [Thauera sinica]|uniref:Tetratricopeptide repeat protein n=1 Tax=Thauera sinica TaxID=2665146 RepID=A0ABW1AMD4_9RHOO